MSKREGGGLALVGCGGVLAAGCAVTALALAAEAGVAWVVTLVLGGFGVRAPFWPTLGAVFLFFLVVGLLSSSSRRGG